MARASKGTSSTASRADLRPISSSSPREPLVPRPSPTPTLWPWTSRGKTPPLGNPGRRGPPRATSYARPRWSGSAPRPSRAGIYRGEARMSRLAHGPATIIVALGGEAAPLVKHLGLRRDRNVDGPPRYRDGGDRILLLQAGMGARGAARAVASLGTPSVLLSAGFCGGVGSGVDLGDLVVASQVIRHAESFPADPFLLQPATGATKAIGLPFHAATILTVDKVMTAGEAAEQRVDGPIVAVDMESAYLAEAA